MPEPRDVRCPRCGRLLARRQGGGLEIRGHGRPPIWFKGPGELECHCGAVVAVEGPAAPSCASPSTAELREVEVKGVADDR